MGPMKRTEIPIGLMWRLRRIAAGRRQQDIASFVGIPTTRYSEFERGLREPSELDRQLIEELLPPLPTVVSCDDDSETVLA